MIYYPCRRTSVQSKQKRYKPTPGHQTQKKVGKGGQAKGFWGAKFQDTGTLKYHSFGKKKEKRKESKTQRSVTRGESDDDPKKKNSRQIVKYEKRGFRSVDVVKQCDLVWYGGFVFILKRTGEI